MKWEWSRRYSSSRGSLTSFTLEEASLFQPSLSRRTASHRLARKLEKEELVEWTVMKLLSQLTFALHTETSAVDIVLPSLDPSL